MSTHWTKCEKIRKLTVVSKLPSLASPYRQPSDIPEGIEGSRILRFGAAPQHLQVDGGGLVIDFEKANGSRRRVVLAFSEMGMWIEGEAEL
jgi:hypothetical protein